MNHLLAPFLKRFFARYLPIQKGLSPHTLAAYRDTLKLLLGYAADTLATTVDALNVEALTQALVVEFLDYLEQVRGCGERTRNTRLAAIRAFFAFVAREEPAFGAALSASPFRTAQTCSVPSRGLPRRAAHAETARCR